MPITRRNTGRRVVLADAERTDRLSLKDVCKVTFFQRLDGLEG
ncbi:hypothetical protein [Actinocorallia libanotica]|uniref:Uncharacterized protein n=1 Tax=Actinocorallia libanotica TaxID=46162 RepID=A0ABN1RYF2_9ACTN